MKKHIIKYLTISFVIFISCKHPQVKNARNIVSGSSKREGNLLAYSTWGKEIIIEDVPTAKPVFHKTIADICYSKPTIKNDILFFPASDSVFSCLNFKKNQLVWNLKLSGRCNDFYLINSVIIANIKHYGIIGIDANSGTVLYQLLYRYWGKCTLPDLSPYRLAFDRESFYVNDWLCNSISAFQINAGKIKWSRDFGFGQSSATIIGKNLFVGLNKSYKGGDIFLLDAKNGDVIFKKECLFEENFNPIIYQGKIIYYSYDSKLHIFDPRLKRDDVIYKFNQRDDVSGNQMFLLGDNLYYNRDKNIYAINLKNHHIVKAGNTEKDICAVVKVQGVIRFLY